MDAACSTYEEEERCVQGFGGKPEGKRPLRIPSTDGNIIYDGTSGSGMLGFGLDRCG